jgi:hypothetical protein
MTPLEACKQAIEVLRSKKGGAKHRARAILMEAVEAAEAPSALSGAKHRQRIVDAFMAPASPQSPTPARISRGNEPPLPQGSNGRRSHTLLPSPPDPSPPES